MARDNNNQPEPIMRRLINITKLLTFRTLQFIKDLIYASIRDGRLLYNLIILGIIMVSTMYFVPMPLLVYSFLQILLNYVFIATIVIYLGVTLFNYTKNKTSDFFNNPLNFLVELKESILNGELIHKLIILELLLVATIILLPMIIPVPTLVLFILENVVTTGLILTLALYAIKIVGNPGNTPVKVIFAIAVISSFLVPGFGIITGSIAVLASAYLVYRYYDDYKEGQTGQRILDIHNRNFNENTDNMMNTIDRRKTESQDIFSTVLEQIKQRGNAIKAVFPIGQKSALAGKLTPLDKKLFTADRAIKDYVNNLPGTKIQKKEAQELLVCLMHAISCYAPDQNERNSSEKLVELCNAIYDGRNEREARPYFNDPNSIVLVERPEEERPEASLEDGQIELRYGKFSIQLNDEFFDSDVYNKIFAASVALKDQNATSLNNISAQDLKEILRTPIDDPALYVEQTTAHQAMLSDLVGDGNLTLKQLIEQDLLRLLNIHEPNMLSVNYWFGLLGSASVNLTGATGDSYNKSIARSAYESVYEHLTNNIDNLMEQIVESKKTPVFDFYGTAIINDFLKELKETDEDTIYSYKDRAIRDEIIENLNTHHYVSKSNHSVSTDAWDVCKNLKLKTSFISFYEELQEMRTLISTQASNEVEYDAQRARTTPKFEQDYLSLYKLLSDSTALDNPDMRAAYLKHISFNRELAFMALPEDLVSRAEKTSWLQSWKEHHPEAAKDNRNMIEPLEQMMDYAPKNISSLISTN